LGILFYIILDKNAVHEKPVLGPGITFLSDLLDLFVFFASRDEELNLV